MASPLFRPLSAITIEALSLGPGVCAGGSDNETLGRDDDLGEDASFAPPPPRFGADDADAAAALAPDSDSDHDVGGGGGTIADADADSMGEWAAAGGCRPGAKVNLAARLAPRRVGNFRHAGAGGADRDRVEERLDRVEDRKRESQARDKLDRATVEQVLDPRTRMILFRLLSRGRLASIDGCVSTGKEANVYYGRAPPGAVAPASGEGKSEIDLDDVAVKVFKTAILSFKDRERYVEGEFRFRRGGYNRQSNRKMVQQWAEKEFRNLIRLRDAGVPAPDPLIIKPPVLVMRFFGRDGWPAPRLKDANVSPERLSSAYADVCVLMRRMYRRAKLVHGDLSEYNILYHKRQVVIIDVSQSVEDDHPMALDFLRRDCMNVNDFFSRSGVSPVLGLRELFDFVRNENDVPSSFTVTPEMVNELSAGEDVYPDADAAADAAVNLELQRRRDAEDAHTRHMFSKALQTAAARGDDERAELEADDVVFHQSFIPQTLDDVYKGDSDMHRSTMNQESRELYARVAGPDASSTPARGDPAGNSNSSRVPDEMAEDIESDSGTTSDGNRESIDRDSDSESDGKQSPEEIKAAKKANKKLVKAEARERRENKMPKHVKKRRDVVAKRRRHVKTKK